MRLMAKKWGLGIALALASAPIILLALASTPNKVLAQPGSVPFSLDPPSIDLETGEIATVSVKVDASNQPVDTVQVFLDFNPSLLQVVDDSGEPTSTVSFGPVINDDEWKQVLLNSVDNSSGRIGLAAGKGLPASGALDMDREFVLAVINFKALGDGAEALITIDLEDQKSPLRSKALSRGVEVTGEGAGAAINIAATDNPPANAPVSINDTNPSVAADSSAQKPSTSSSGTAIAPTTEARAAAVATPIAPNESDTKAASTSPGASVNKASPGPGPVIFAGMIGGVIVLGLGILGTVLFLRGRRSRQPERSRAIPLGPASG